MSPDGMKRRRHGEIINLMLRSLLIFISGICAVALAQTKTQTPSQKPEAEPTPFRVMVNEVIVPVTVTDYKGRFISDLNKADFKIFEDGREQKIEYFSREHNQPVVVGFVLDLSSSSRIHWKNFQETAMQMVWALLPEESKDNKYSGFLVTYATEAELAVNTTSLPEPIVDKIRTLKPGGGAALFDAIAMALTKHKQIKGEPIEPRRVLIVFGDGNDNASKYTVDQVIELAQRNLVTIYAISTQAFGFNNETQETLERLTGETGGHVEYPLNSLYKDVSGYLSNPSDAGNYVYEVGTGGYEAQIAAGITRAVQGLVSDISTQYILRYTPDVDPDAKEKVTHRIKVEIPSLPAGVSISYRKFYYPNGVPQGPPASH